MKLISRVCLSSSVVTSVLVFEEDGKIQEYIGGYSDWANRGKELKIADTQDHPSGHIIDHDTMIHAKKAPKGKLSYKFQRELDMLPNQIDKLETEIAVLQEQTADPDFYSLPYTETQSIVDAQVEKQQALDNATTRWIELEEMRGGG